MPKSRAIRRQSHLKNLTALRDFVEHTCVAAGVDDETIFAFKLAVDEACTNIITHGYATGERGMIGLACACEPAQVVVTITDRGRPFDPAAPLTPDLDSEWTERQVGGLGIFFIQQMMDVVRYQPDSTRGNRLILIKARPPHADA